jgi:hypothetical protein
MLTGTQHEGPRRCLRRSMSDVALHRGKVREMPFRALQGLLLDLDWPLLVRARLVLSPARPAGRCPGRGQYLRAYPCRRVRCQVRPLSARSHTLP